MSIKIFLDSANIDEMRKAYDTNIIKGFTINPTLMKRAGIKDYEDFAKTVIKEFPDVPISFEVLSDGFIDMETEAHIIAGWGRNIYIKIPIINTKGRSTAPLIRALSEIEEYKINVTTISTKKQLYSALDALSRFTPSIISIFAGRIMDTGRDPIPLMRSTKNIVNFNLSKNKNTEILWASSREVYNIKQAENCGCDIITVTYDILNKYIQMKDKDLDELTLDTVKQFHQDAQGYKLGGE